MIKSLVILAVLLAGLAACGQADDGRYATFDRGRSNTRA